MIARWHRWSLAKKTTCLVMLACLLALTVFEVAFMTVQAGMLHEQERRSLNTLAESLAINSTAALTFGDADAAKQTLNALQAAPEVVFARMVDKHGRVFVSYQRPGHETQAQPDPSLLAVQSPIAVQGEYLGMVELHSNRSHVQMLMQQSLGLGLLLALVTLVLSGWLARISARILTLPLLRLAALANWVGQAKDYSVRAPETGATAGDETEQLAHQFNEMLSQIEARERQLKDHQEHLEQEVALRTQDLLRARDAAEAASRAKSDFLAMMSHEIRTPLNGVIGMTDLLASTALDERQRRYIRIVRRSGEDLLTIINDILDFSKIEAGKMELEHSPFNLNFLLEDIVERFAPIAHGKGLEILCAPPMHHTVLVGDSKRLTQIITNLVGNAIKFTERGQVLLRAQVEAAENNSVRCHIHVIDTGIGIATERLSHLFQAFTQADSSTTRRFGGTGLGLAISQRLVELMHAHIEVTSELGQGSDFHFTLLLPVERQAPGQEPSSSLQNLKVLILDDNDVNLEILQHQLAAWDCRVEQTQTVAAAMHALQRAIEHGQPFQMVISDVMMPVQDGTHLLELMQQHPDFSELPVLMLSSAGNEKQLQARLHLPAQRILTKPVRQSELYNAVLACLEPTTSDSPPAAPAYAETLWTTLEGRVLLAEDNHVNQEVALAMLHNLGLKVEVAGHGADALELLKQQAFDLVLMDCQMPVLDGYATTQEIRQKEQASGNHLPIIALTANAVAGDRQRCIAAGMDDYLAKPFTQEQLQATLQRWLPVAHTAQPRLHANTETPALDASAIETLRKLRPGLLLKVLDAWLQESPLLIKEMQQACQKKDAQTLYRAAHALKNSAGNVGALDLKQGCVELEQRGRQGQMEQVQDLLADVQQRFAVAQAALQQLQQGERP